MSVIVLILTAILLFFYLLSMETKIGLNWLEIELIFALVSSLIFMLISSLFVVYDGAVILKVAAVSTRTITMKTF